MGNVLKTIGGIVTSPIKAGGKILTGKGNIGDFLNVASMFAPGGNILAGGNLAKFGTSQLGKNLGTAGLLRAAGIGDPSKLTLGSGLGMLGGLGAFSAGANPQNYQQGTTQFTQNPNGAYDLGGTIGNFQQFANALTPQSLKEIQDYAKLAPIRAKYLQLASKQFDPAQQQAMAHQLGDRLRASNLAHVNQTASAIGNNDAIPGLTLDAMNRGTDAENQAVTQAYDPSHIAQGYATAASLLSPGEQMPTTGMSLQFLQALLGAQGQQASINNAQGYLKMQQQMNRPATFGESLIGAIPNIAGLFGGNRPQQQNTFGTNLGNISSFFGGGTDTVNNLGKSLQGFRIGL